MCRLLIPSCVLLYTSVIVVGDQTAVKTREIVTHYHLVYVPIDIVFFLKKKSFICNMGLNGSLQPIDIVVSKGS